MSHSHKHYLTATLSSCCHHDQNNQNNIHLKSQERQRKIYQIVSKKMEQQLRSLQNNKNQQIQILLEQNRNLQIQNQKLLIKLNIGKESQQKFILKIQELQNKIQELNNKIFSLQVSSLHSNVKETVKQIIVREPLNQYHQIKIQNLQKEILQLKSEKQSSILQTNGLKSTLQILNGKLSELQSCLKSKQKHLKQILEQNRNLVYDMEQTKLIYQKYHQQLKELRQSDPIIIEKHKIKEIPVLVDQYNKEKNVQTTKDSIEVIYVQRPIQKIKFVQIQKFITQFVEPERPMVTRIIDCGENTRNKSNCGCGN